MTGRKVESKKSDQQKRQKFKIKVHKPEVPTGVKTESKKSDKRAKAENEKSDRRKGGNREVRLS